MLRLTWVLAASLLVACGGSNNSDLTAHTGGGGSRADASAGSGGGGTAGGNAGGGTAGGSGGTAGGSGGTAGGSGGMTGGSGGMTGGSGGAPPTGGSGGSSGGAGGSGGTPAAGSVKCGLKICSIATQSCCFGDNITPYCFKTGTLGGCKCTGLLCETAVVHCDGPEDCGAGQVCCATKGVTGTHFNQLSCAKTCQGGITSSAGIVCHLNTSGECAANMKCATDNRLPGGYGLCAP